MRRHFFFARKACTIQRAWRRYYTQKRFHDLVVSAVDIQAFLRMRLWRSWFLGMKSSQSVLAKYWRQWWLKQTERMATESFKRNDFTEGSHAAIDGTHVGGVFGQMVLFGIQGKQMKRVGAWRGSLERIS